VLNGFSFLSGSAAFRAVGLCLTVSRYLNPGGYASAKRAEAQPLKKFRTYR